MPERMCECLYVRLSCLVLSCVVCLFLLLSISYRIIFHLLFISPTFLSTAYARFNIALFFYRSVLEAWMRSNLFVLWVYEWVRLSAYFISTTKYRRMSVEYSSPDLAWLVLIVGTIVHLSVSSGIWTQSPCNHHNRQPKR